MLVFVNGAFVPAEQAVVSVFDRGFLFGDGVFETMRVTGGRLIGWSAHVRRLEHGLRLLAITPPYPAEEMRRFCLDLISRNALPEALLRVNISRGIGLRGYSPEGAVRPTVVLSLHPAPVIDLEHPPCWRLVTSSLRLPAGSPLAQSKTANKLPQILARAEAEAAGAEEALLLNTLGEVGILFLLFEQVRATRATAPAGGRLK